MRLSTPVSGGSVSVSGVVDHLDLPPARVVGVDLVVRGGGHVHDPAVEPDALAAGERGGPGTCRRVGVVAAAGSGTSRHAPIRSARPSRPRASAAEVRPARGREAVEAAVAHVLGEVHALPARVHRGGLVLEHAHAPGGPPHACAPWDRTPTRGRVSTSSQESQVPHGVAPPEQLTSVLARIR